MTIIEEIHDVFPVCAAVFENVFLAIFLPGLPL